MIDTLFGPNRNCTHHLLLILALSVLRAGATERWEVLPPHPLPRGSGQANVTRLFRALTAGSPFFHQPENAAEKRFREREPEISS
jgi:hypothetical protein